LEIRKHPEQLNRLRDPARQGSITLVSLAHDEGHNDIVVLKDFLLRRPVMREADTASQAG